ncbi:MAG: DUF624 domain-containing protein [Clostridium sp.]|nr:DUF624 domain-containing protein [Clostridium sp.]
MSFFSPEGALYRFITRFWDIVKLSVLWLVFSLPIVTTGAATVAVFSVTMKMIDESEGYVAHQFVKAFKANLRNGIPLGALFIVCMEVVNFDFQMFQKGEGNPMMPLIFGIIALFVFMMGFVYAFPLSARYENTLFRTIKNSADIATRYFLRTLSLFFLLFVEILLIFFNWTTLFVGALIGPGCICLTISGYAVPFFREIEKEEGAVTYKQTEKEEELHKEE